MNILKTKWCTYCEKDTHDDAECWCTRALPPLRPAIILTGLAGLAPPFASSETNKALLQAVERAPRLPRQDISGDPPFVL